MIDLHTHTTASDGRCTPEELVSRASAAGITTLSVTDHDTLASCPRAAAACAAASIAFVAGIEITAARDDVDVHTLGYFVDPESPALSTFLAAQRQGRLQRVREMVARLARLGMVLDGDAILKPAIDDPSKSAGRPWVARALVAAGHAATIGEAFDRWLSPGRPAFVGRPAAPPEEVIARIHEAGGVASLAHPGLLKRDEWLPGLADAGLDAVEAYHSEHASLDTSRYLAAAAQLGLAVSGGSDYHADQAHGNVRLGAISLPPDAFERLRARKRT